MKVTPEQWNFYIKLALGPGENFIWFRCKLHLVQVKFSPLLEVKISPGPDEICAWTRWTLHLNHVKFSPGLEIKFSPRPDEICTWTRWNFHFYWRWNFQSVICVMFNPDESFTLFRCKFHLVRVKIPKINQTQKNFLVTWKKSFLWSWTVLLL